MAVSGGRAPSIGECAWTITTVKAMLRWRGLRPTARYAMVTTPDGGAIDDPAALIEHTAHQVAVAAIWYPGRARCLEQALTLCRLLRYRGIDATFKLGVQPYRFRAHAWVEYRGVPINEPGDGITGYAVLPDMPL